MADASGSTGGVDELDRKLSAVKPPSTARKWTYAYVRGRLLVTPHITPDWQLPDVVLRHGYRAGVQPVVQEATGGGRAREAPDAVCIQQAPARPTTGSTGLRPGGRGEVEGDGAGYVQCACRADGATHLSSVVALSARRDVDSERRDEIAMDRVVKTFTEREIIQLIAGLHLDTPHVPVPPPAAAAAEADRDDVLITTPARKTSTRRATPDAAPMAATVSPMQLAPPTIEAVQRSRLQGATLEQYVIATSQLDPLMRPHAPRRTTYQKRYCSNPHCTGRTSWACTGPQCADKFFCHSGDRDCWALMHGIALRPLTDG
jgi:hypothetical protein